MKHYKPLLILTIIFTSLFAFPQMLHNENKNFLSHTVDLKKQDLKFYWKNEADENFGNFGNLQKWLESKSKKMAFATNGGMYTPEYSPKGLYIENGKILSKMDTKKEGFGNFYMQPNGIFAINSQNQAIINKTQDFEPTGIQYATQSGPLLLINGKINSNFRKESTNLHIRNGVGILPNGQILFAMSNTKINFYDFANYFRSKGCQNALYLDGFVSKTYLPSKNSIPTDGIFGVIIAETVDQE